jgi:hypothetical protein
MDAQAEPPHSLQRLLLLHTTRGDRASSLNSIINPNLAFTRFLSRQGAKNTKDAKGREEGKRKSIVSQIFVEQMNLDRITLYLDIKTLFFPFAFLAFLCVFA